MTGKKNNCYQVVAKYIRMMNLLKRLARTRTDINLQPSELIYYARANIHL